MNPHKFLPTLWKMFFVVNAKKGQVLSDAQHDLNSLLKVGNVWARILVLSNADLHSLNSSTFLFLLIKGKSRQTESIEV